jgi:hypothetical protein
VGRVSPLGRALGFEGGLLDVPKPSIDAIVFIAV